MSKIHQNSNNSNRKGKNAWNPLAEWYSGWVGTEGSKYHQALAFPHTLNLLKLKKGDKLLDIGCGTGVFSKHVFDSGAEYFGIDISKKMILEAKKEFSKFGKFTELDVLKMQPRGDFTPWSFDAVTFILSIQDMPEIERVISTASGLLKKGGKFVIFMKHPAFNIPRQSGWIEDKQRSLTSRRVDRYLTPLDMPLVKKLGGQTITTFHHHRSLGDYIECLIKNNLDIYAFNEIADTVSKDKNIREFPLFLAIGAGKRAYTS
jgi:ubiquinone/menaquinone biosynthesis C-methylase UbiE